MAPDRLEECLTILRWTRNTLASVMECDMSLVDAWLVGLAEIPADIAAWVETLATIHEQIEAMKPAGLNGKSYTY